MENNDYIKNIERRIREIAKDYEDKGYSVVINPSQNQLPSFLKGFEPDIIATREEENVLVEIKTRKNRQDLQRFESLAREIDKRKDWRFEVVFTNPKDKPFSTESQQNLSENAINNRITEINKLIGIDSYEAAFLLSWATIEAVLRQKLNEEKSETVKKPTLSIIKTMFSLGLINQHDYKKLQEVNNYRNSLIHGFYQHIDKETVQNILLLINNLTGKNQESEFLEWLNNVDLENYEEIYSLYRTAVDKENYGLFEIFEGQDKIILKANHMDDTLEFENDEDLLKFADLIEEEYMDDMGAEGWYAFHKAMEKDD